MSLSLQLTIGDWLAFFNHFLSLSLLAVGGAIITAPDMHRFLVDHNEWLTEQQFSSSIALAQASPGPNVLFVAVIGWNVGLNAGAGLGGGGHPRRIAQAKLLTRRSLGTRTHPRPWQGPCQSRRLNHYQMVMFVQGPPGSVKVLFRLRG
jgi:hypothetical protein